MKEDAPASNGTNGKGVIKGDGVPAIDQATLESIDHRRGEYTKRSREYASYLCFAIAALLASAKGRTCTRRLLM